jgi:DNA-binding transcriptional LysR family regulator
MALDLRDLTVFLAVERKGSFGRAATELLITQPAVSERIRHLEREIGRPVFVRSPRGVTLTEAGEALLPYARRCDALAEESLAAARAARGAARFVIAVHATYAPRVVPIVLDALADQPRRVSVRDAHSEAVAPLVLDGSADLGISIPAAAIRGVRRVPMRPDPIICVAAPGHPIVRRRRPTPAALADGLIALNAWGDGAETALATLRRGGVPEERIRYCADVTTAVTLAVQHGHVALVTRSDAEAHLTSGALRVVPLTGLGRWVMRLDVVHRSQDASDPAIRAAVARLRDA